MQRINFKLAIVRKDIRYWRLAAETNKQLSPQNHLSEQHVTQIVTCRKDPSPEQAKALATVLDCETGDLFPGIGNGGAA